MENLNLIPTYIITPKDHCATEEITLKQFISHTEFSVNIVKRVDHHDKTVSLKKTIQQIVRLAVENNDDFILICTDDHQFADNYSKERLFEAINSAKALNADILCGGINLFWSAIRISKSIFWVEDFTGLRFTILFRSYYVSVLEGVSKILPYTNAKFFIFPFLSIRRQPASANKLPIEFNTNSLEDCSMQVKMIDTVSAFYNNTDSREFNFNENNYENISIPTYIINLPERIDRLTHIKNQFLGKKEFDIQIIEACSHPVGAVGLWESIRKIIKKATNDDHEFIIICEDDHEFTSQYSKSFLFKNIIEASRQQAEMLAGGICEFHMAIPITDQRVWVDTSFCTQFTILFKPAFEKILNQAYDDNVTADAMLSYLITNKMVLYPFISTQKHFGYSDVTQHNNDNHDLLNQSFTRENARLKRIYNAKATYGDS